MRGGGGKQILVFMNFRSGVVLRDSMRGWNGGRGDGVQKKTGKYEWRKRGEEGCGRCIGVAALGYKRAEGGVKRSVEGVA